MIVEGEALLNDGISVVVFGIVAAVGGIGIYGNASVLVGANEILAYGITTFGSPACISGRAPLRSRRFLPWADHQVDFAIENLKERQQLIDRLSGVLLVEQPVELRGRCPETPDNFTSR